MASLNAKAPCVMPGRNTIALRVKTVQKFFAENEALNGVEPPPYYDPSWGTLRNIRAWLWKPNSELTAEQRAWKAFHFTHLVPINPKLAQPFKRKLAQDDTTSSETDDAVNEAATA